MNPYQNISDSSKNINAMISYTVIIACWCLISFFDILSTNKLPSIFSLTETFIRLAGDGTLLKAIYASSARVFSAAILVVTVGTFIGVILGSSQKINSFIAPIIDPFRSAPVAALLPLFVIWFKVNEPMKIAFLFTGAIVYMIPLVRDAISTVPYAYWESARDLGGTKFECIVKGILPIAMPRIFDAGIISTSILWTYITVAEYVNAGTGLGQLIQDGKRLNSTEHVFIGVMVIMAMALITHTVLTFVRKKLYFWENK